MKKNIVVAGFGFMGMTHTQNILNNPHLHLSALVDKHPENIRKNLQAQSGNFSTGSLPADLLSNVAIYEDFSACLQKERPDAVVIAVHTRLHYPLAAMALEAGADVFLEKPFCLDISEGEKLIALAREKKRILMIAHVVRFMPAYLTLKSWIDSGLYGNLQFLSLSRFSGVPAWGEWKEKQRDFGSSGGALFDLVIHDIDFAQWVCGLPDLVESTCLPGRLSNHDYVSAFWKYGQSDLLVKIEGGNTFHTQYPFQAAFSARFDKASVLFSCKDPENIIVTTDSETTLVPAGDAMNGFSGELDYFTECMFNNLLPSHCTPESALDAVRLCHRHVR